MSDDSLLALREVPGVDVTAVPPVVDPLAGAPTIHELRRKYDSFREATSTNADLQLQDRHYFDGKQLSTTVRATLRTRGQPPTIDNRIKPAILGTLGILEQAQADPRAYPRNPHPNQENAADVATKALRFISDTNRFDEIKLDCAEEHQIEGLCAAIIEIGEEDDIVVTQIPWKDFFYDPRSTKADFKDALYMGTAKWMYAADVQRLYPERYAEMGDPVRGAMTPMDGRGEDKPFNETAWLDKKMSRLMLVEIYYREGGEWMRCVYCSAGIFEFGPSAYQDDKGRSVCPIEATSCFVDSDLNRYGRVRDMVTMQDEVNARRSRGLHLLNSRQVQEVSLGAGQGTDVETVRTEMGKADGVIPTGWRAVPTSDMAAGNLTLLQEAKDSLARMAPTPALLDRDSSSAQSGRARLVRQQAGMTEIARPLGRLEHWENRCYGQFWWRARQFWTGPKWVRVTDDVRAPTFIQLNAPDGSNQIAQMDMDIIVDTVPDTATLEQEVWGDLLELLKMYPPESPQFQIAVEMSPIADKQRILERIKAYKKEQAQEAQGQAQQAAQAQQMQVAELEAKIADLKAAALLKAAQADQATMTTNIKQSENFAALGPIAVAFGNAPDHAGVAEMQARVHPDNAPPPMPTVQAAMEPAPPQPGEPPAS